MGKTDKKTEKKAASVAKPAKEDKKAAVKVPSSKDILAKAKKAVSLSCISQICFSVLTTLF